MHITMSLCMYIYRCIDPWSMNVRFPQHVAGHNWNSKRSTTTTTSCARSISVGSSNYASHCNTLKGQQLDCNEHMGVSENRGLSPQIIHFNRVFQYKPSILGYPYFFGNTHMHGKKMFKNESIYIHLCSKIYIYVGIWGWIWTIFQNPQRDMERRSTISSCVWPSWKSIESLHPHNIVVFFYILQADFFSRQLKTQPDPTGSLGLGNSWEFIFMFNTAPEVWQQKFWKKDGCKKLPNFWDSVWFRCIFRDF